jgi:putative ABC transport system permease protein
VRLLPLASKSLWNRRSTVVLAVSSIALSVSLLLGVEKVRTGAKQTFTNTISGTDLIVGARGSGINLLLYSVFRIGNATANVSWETYKKVAASPTVAWSIPLSLGDSYQGYRVLGTNDSYFRHYRYAQKPLSFSKGNPFSDVFDAVLGAEVARKLGHKVGDEIVIAHGLRSIGTSDHDDKPFRVTGILSRTGTPVDRTVHISLEGIEAIHVDWAGGAQLPGDRVSAEEARKMDLTPRSITAFMVGMKTKIAIFGLQRNINTYRDESLSAIIPGVTLQELWDTMDTAESALMVISIMVVLVGLMGMLTMIMAGLNERRREMAILRSVGARPAHILGLFVLEAVLLALLGAIMGVTLLYAALYAGRPLVEARYGLSLPIEFLTSRDLIILGMVVVAGFVSGLVPSIRAYRYSLADGMAVQT